MNSNFTKKGLGLSTALLLGSQMNFAQISGNVSVGTGQTYTSLSGAGGLFSVINTGGLNGNLTVTITSDLAETGATTLNQWTEDISGANYTLTIMPADGIEKVISGAATNGLITFNGADRVTIDGSYSGAGRYLRFKNTTAGTSASTFSFLADATNNNIKNCIIEGATTATTIAQTGAVIFLGTGTSGNDNNSFIGNKIEDISGAANVPTYLLKNSSSTTAAASNDNNIVYNNEFLNFSSVGTIVGNTSGSNNGGSGWIIRKNAYYQTVNRTTALTCIQLATGNNHTVDSNNIGGSAADRTGSPMTTSTGPIYGINVSSTNTTSATSMNINNNNISNINLTATTGVVYGIYSVANNKINYNVIGGYNLPTDIINSSSSSIMGIMLTTNTNTVKGNRITNFKSTAAVNAMSAGINIQAGSFTVDSNVVDSITSNTGAVQTGGNALCGININSVTSGTANIISRNKISNLILTNPTAAACAAGILTQNTTYTGVLKIVGNNVSNVMGVSSGTNNIAGIMVNYISNTSADSLYNNIINIGSGTTSNSVIYGIAEASNASTTHTYFNNTVVITGTTNTAANCTTAAFWRRNASTATLRNNIFFNQRATTGAGTTGNNYAIYNNAAATTTQWKSDYNLLYNLDDAKILYWQPTAAAYSFAGLTAVALSDTNSVTGNVPFMDLANNNLHINGTDPDSWNLFGRGTAQSKIAADFDGNARSVVSGTPITIGAYEISVPSSVPADMVMTPSIPTLGTPTVFTSAGRKIAEINWGTSAPVSFASAKYYPGVQAPNQTMVGPYLNSYFELNVTPDVNTYDYTIKSYYTAAEANGISNTAMTGVKKHSTNAYVATDAGNTSSADVDGRFLTSNVLSDFSIFSMTGDPAPLSIDLKTIAAKNAGNKNSIDWSTAKENKSDYFELESSTDGRNFSKIAKIEAKGQASAYTYWDEKAALGVTYYRLKMTIDNGSFVYSKTVNAEMKSLSSFNLTAYPNPVQNKLSLRIAGSIQGNATVVVKDITGKTLQTLKVNGNEVEIDMNNLAKGIYFIKYNDGRQTQTLKVSKQ